MTKALAATAVTILLAAAAQAETRIDTLCGADHRNEVVSLQDVQPNPGGYYIVSLRTQLSHGDPRIQFSAGDAFHLCTTSAATPDMDTTRALQLMGLREVKFLFVPILLATPMPQS